MVYQGAAMFSPEQINFEFQWSIDRNGGGIKSAYAINRKTLRYTNTSYGKHVIDIGTGPIIRDWKIIESKDNPKIGQCSIMKTPPTAGNKI